MKLLCLYFIIMLPLVADSMNHRQWYGVQDAQVYILNKLTDNDIVFAGTVHRQPAILKLMADLIPELHPNGITHLALEIPSDQQKYIDEYLDGRGAIDRIKLHEAIDCPKYRHLFKVLKRLPPAARPNVIAIDLPIEQYGGTIPRNAYMAYSLASIIDSHRQVKILAILGSVHVLRKLQWQHDMGPGYEAIRTHLRQWKRDLNMFSIIHIVDRIDAQCDFGRRMSPISGTVAVDLDHRFKGWHLGATDCMALRPAQPYELVDGVIVH